MVSRNAILASDYYLVPTIPDFISCYGIPFILQHIENMQEELREKGKRVKAQFLGIVRNRVRHAHHALVREHEDQSHRLKLDYGDRLLESMITDRIGIAELLGSRKNIHHDKTEKTADIRKDFADLTREVIRRIEKG